MMACKVWREIYMINKLVSCFSSRSWGCNLSSICWWFFLLRRCLFIESVISFWFKMNLYFREAVYGWGIPYIWKTVVFLTLSCGTWCGSRGEVTRMDPFLFLGEKAWFLLGIFLQACLTALTLKKKKKGGGVGGAFPQPMLLSYLRVCACVLSWIFFVRFFIFL